MNLMLHQNLSKKYSLLKGRIKIISSSTLALSLHYDYMGLSLYEILRADLNDDGIEDLLIGTYEWALEGTYGVGSTIALTRLGIDQPFTIADNIELDVYRLDNHRIQADAAEPRR